MKNLETAWKRSWKSYHQGLSRKDCPFLEESLELFSWMSGFNAASMNQQLKYL